jgi:hypothetical protein
VLKELLLGVDIGLFTYLIFLYLKIKRIEIQKKIDNILANNIPSNELKDSVLNIRGRLAQNLGKRYKPLSEILKQEFKYLSIFLLIYNITVAIVYIIS